MQANAVSSPLITTTPNTNKPEMLLANLGSETETGSYSQAFCEGAASPIKGEMINDKWILKLCIMLHIF